MLPAACNSCPGALFIFLERSRIGTSSPIQQVSMVTQDINILYVLCHVKGPARRCIQKTPKGTALMWMALCSQLNICFWVYSRRGKGPAWEAVCSARRCIRTTAILQSQLLFCGAWKVVSGESQGAEAMRAVSTRNTVAWILLLVLALGIPLYPNYSTRALHFFFFGCCFHA